MWCAGFEPANLRIKPQPREPFAGCHGKVKAQRGKGIYATVLTVVQHSDPASAFAASAVILVHEYGPPRREAFPM